MTTVFNICFLCLGILALCFIWKIMECAIHISINARTTAVDLRTLLKQIDLLLGRIHGIRESTGTAKHYLIQLSEQLERLLRSSWESRGVSSGSGNPRSTKRVGP